LLVLIAARASLAADDPPLFENAASALGLEGVPAERCTLADLDGDGAPDAILDGARVYMNRPAPGGGRRLERVTERPPIAAPGTRAAGCVQVADVDGDSAADLFVGRSSDFYNPKWIDDGLRNEIRRGDGRGGFVEVIGSGVGARAETTISACFLDFDRDGLLDVFVGNSYTRYGESLEAYPSRLFRGTGGGAFEDVTERAGLLGVAQAGLRESRKPTYGATHADWNDDGLPDILAPSYGRQWNRLYENRGDGTFVDRGEATGFDGDEDRSGAYPEWIRKSMARTDEQPFRSNGNTFDAAVADYDDDGDLDVFLGEITHAWAGPSSDLSMLLENLGPGEGYRFRRRPDAIPPRPHEGRSWNQGDMHAGWIDVENDGRLDLVIASSDYPDDQLLRIYHQRADHTFEERTHRLGVRWLSATQISFGDVDRDGATDILVATNGSRLTAEQRAAKSPHVGLLRNLAAAREGNRFLAVRLRGKGKGASNTDAIGARVTLEVGGRRMTREVRGGSGHAGHRDDLEVVFGVGKAERVDALTVRWPNAAGTVQRFTGLETGRHYALEEGLAPRVVPGGVAR